MRHDAGNAAAEGDLSRAGDRLSWGMMSIVMLKEARRHPAYQLPLSIPLLGPISMAQLTRSGARRKRQFWTYLVRLEKLCCGKLLTD